MTNPANVPSVASEAEALKSGTTEAQLWLKKIGAAKDEEEKWRKDARAAEEAYEADEKANVAFNVLHSNVQTLVPALYNSSPVPDVRRRFGDADPVGKQVVDVIERMLSESCDEYDIDHAFKAAVKDSAVTGRGVIRLRYEPQIEMQMDQNKQQYEVKGYESTFCERVPWDKFIRGPARAWEQVPFVAFEHDLTKDEIKKLDPEFAKSVGGQGSEEKKVDGTTRDPKGILQTTRVYEIWDKASRSVMFVTDGEMNQIIKREADPLGLPDFFPVMRPLYPAERISSLIPLCPYNIVKPLVEELQVITRRIDKLIRQLRVRGLYDSKLGVDIEKLKSCDDGQYEAAANVELFAAAGGLEKAVAHWPMDATIKALQQLYMQRTEIRAIIDQIAGVSDILRGQVDPREKLGQSQIKTQWGSIRIQDWQNAVAAMARELFRAKTHIFAKHYSDQNISLITGLPMNDEQKQLWPQVVQLFRSQQRSYRIDIETDSTIRADMTRNQDQMNQFLAGTAQFAQAMAGIIQIPDMGQRALPVIVEVFTSFARKFKLGKQAEDALDKLSSDVAQAQEQPQEQKPDPAAQKAEAEMQAMQVRAQLEEKALQNKAAHDERMAQLTEQLAQLKIQVAQTELEQKRQSAAIDSQTKMEDAKLRREEADENRMERSEMRAHAAMMNEIKVKNASQPRVSA